MAEQSPAPWGTESDLLDAALVDRMPASSGGPSRPDALPPKPKYRGKSGLTDTDGKDYNIIKTVEGMNRTRSNSRGPSPRSHSRTKNYIENARDKTRMMDTKSSELGGVLTRARSTSKPRAESRGPRGFLSRGRSKSSRQVSDYDEGQQSSSKSSRSKSRMGKGFLKKMRSLSRRRKSSPEAVTQRGRTHSRVNRGVEESERLQGDTMEHEQQGTQMNSSPESTTRDHLSGQNSKHAHMANQVEEIPRDDVEESNNIPPMAKKLSERTRTPYSSTDDNVDDDAEDEDPVTSDEDPNACDENINKDAEVYNGVNETEIDRPEPDIAPESDSENEDEEDDPDALTETDVMHLDRKNTKMHIACLLHYPSRDIVSDLKLDNSLAFKPNSAGELPLHYAMMDKKGVNDEVLLTLLNINPDAVQYPNAHRSLPIHLACLSGAANKDAIRALVSMCPDSVMVRSKYPLPFELDMLDNVENESDTEDEVEAEKQPDTTSASSSFFDLIGMGSQAPPPPSGSEPKRSKKKECVDDELTKGKQMYETGWTPLHLAIINGAESTVIELIVSANPNCVFAKTNRGRMPIDCAQYLVRQHWLYGTDDEATVQKNFAAIELLEETAIDYS